MIKKNCSVKHSIQYLKKSYPRSSDTGWALSDLFSQNWRHRFESKEPLTNSNEVIIMTKKKIITCPTSTTLLWSMSKVLRGNCCQLSEPRRLLMLRRLRVSGWRGWRWWWWCSWWLWGRHWLSDCITDCRSFLYTTLLQVNCNLFLV